MKIEMLTTYASPERSVQAGQIEQFPNEEAELLIEAGFARAVDEEGVRTRPAAAAKTRGRGKATPKGEAKPKDEGTENDGQGDGASEGDGAGGQGDGAGS